MTDRIKQHYVPQFYFRNFARDERICTYNLASETGYRPTHIRNICYERHFYGEDGEIEEATQVLENEMAPVVHSIVEDESLGLIEEDHEKEFFFDLFITHLHGRTKAARKDAAAVSQKVLEMMVQLGVESGELGEKHLSLVEEGKIRLEGPDHELRQLLSFYGPIHIADLNRVLIQNHASIDFITSDNPVILDNSRFKNETEAGTIGLDCSGLQIFCPLSPDLLVHYYDPGAYVVRKEQYNNVRVSENSIVQKLNNLQLIYSLENVYYRNEKDKRKVDRLYQSVKNHRPDEPVSQKELRQNDPSQDRERRFVLTHNTKIRYTPDLPFVAHRSEARFSPIRDRELHDLARSMVDEKIEWAKRQENSKE